MAQTNEQPAFDPLAAFDIGSMTAKIMGIAGKSQQVLNSFFERNKAMMSKLPSNDPAHLGQAFNDFMKETLADPHKFVEQQIAFTQDYVRLLQNTLAYAKGQPHEAVIAPDATDRRFADAAWQESWIFDYVKQSYLLVSRWADNLVADVHDIDPKLAHKVKFYTHQMIDAIAPTNFWITNPEVLRKTMETRGENLIKGLENLLQDMESGHGQLRIKMSDYGAFHLGENIGTSKGKVVYQNDLMQLIQYSPLTEQVNKTPFLVTPPWINKFYILDLKPENSFIRYLVEQGHTVFCISWVNPDQRHADMGFEDYMMLGPITAACEIAKITGEKELNILGYCIGGTLVATTLAWLANAGSRIPAGMPKINSATYLVSLVDFSEPGDLGVFIDEDQIKMIENMMQDTGYLPASTMGMTFSMLRANDLIWSFVVNNYLLGKEPFPFDLLAWNADSTNLPKAMQSFYLRNMYLENNLVQPGRLSMKDVPIDLTKITVPSFLLSTYEDHITPWRSTYAGTQLYKGPVTFCLSRSGHIAGVVNPPAKKKYGYWTNPVSTCPVDPEEWLKGASKNEGSWWPEWIKWLSQYAGEKVAPRDPANNPNATEDAPGSYVKVKMV